MDSEDPLRFPLYRNSFKQYREKNSPKDSAPPVSRMHIHTPNSYIYSAFLHRGEGIAYSNFSPNKWKKC